jgi:hypothetical protein
MMVVPASLRRLFPGSSPAVAVLGLALLLASVLSDVLVPNSRLVLPLLLLGGLARRVRVENEQDLRQSARGIFIQSGGGGRGKRR